MMTNVAAPGGWELALVLITSAIMLTTVLLPVYLVVRLASRPRRLPVDDQLN